MDDFYTSFLRELPRDEWGHPVLPTPEKVTRREYAARPARAPDRAREDAAMGTRQR